MLAISRRRFFVSFFARAFPPMLASSVCSMGLYYPKLRKLARKLLTRDSLLCKYRCMVVATVFLTLLGISAVWFLQARSRNRRIARQQESLKRWINRESK